MVTGGFVPIPIAIIIIPVAIGARVAGTAAVGAAVPSGSLGASVGARDGELVLGGLVGTTSDGSKPSMLTDWKYVITSGSLDEDRSSVANSSALVSTKSSTS